MKMKKTKILAVLIGILIIAGISLAPSITASQVDLTLEERIETWLNNNTELSDPEKINIIGWLLVFIELCRQFCGEALGLLIGTFLVSAFVFVPFLIISSVLGVPAIVNVIDLVLENREFDLDNLIDALIAAIGYGGIALLLIIALPFLLVICVLLYPVSVVGVLITLYAELYWYIREAFC